MNRCAASTIGVALLVSLAAVDVYGASGSDYWATWRGPNATGVAPSGNPPVTWSETENVKWKLKLPGQGSSSPVVWGDRIFFLAAIETDKKGTPVPQAGSGSQGPSGSGRRPFHGGKTPTNVYKFEVACLDRKSGEILWQRTAREELPHEGHHPNGSFASYSPVTDG